jgi:hypothetical protein
MKPFYRNPYLVKKPDYIKQPNKKPNNKKNLLNNLILL